MRVGITGSYKVEPELEKDWALEDTEVRFRQACEQIGAALRERQVELVCGGDGDLTADRHVVAGYLRQPNGAGRITVVSNDRRDKPFADLSLTHDGVFSTLRLGESVWRHTRQEFIERCDAMITIAGGKGTYETGLALHSRGVPLLPVGSFGGASAQLLPKVIGSPQSYAILKPDLLGELGNPWTPRMSRVLVDALGLLDPLPIFMIHGHSTHISTVVEWMKREGVGPIVLADLLRPGDSIIDKFQAALRVSRAAVAVVTPDDVAHSLREPEKQEARARQNIWFEIGCFYAALGRKRVFVLLQEDVCLPSDLHGLYYDRFREDPRELAPRLETFLRELQHAPLPRAAPLVAAGA